jgi:hypothetical protein
METLNNIFMVLTPAMALGVLVYIMAKPFNPKRINTLSIVWCAMFLLQNLVLLALNLYNGHSLKAGLAGAFSILFVFLLMDALKTRKRFIEG